MRISALSFGFLIEDFYSDIIKMANPRICSSCLSDAIEIDDAGNVCSNCGLVLSSNEDFRNDPSQLCYYSNTDQKCFPNLPLIISNSLPHKKTSQAKQISIKAIETFAKQFKLNKNMISQLLELYREALYHSEFNCCFLKKKFVLGAVCIYLIMLKNNWMITIDLVCQKVGCSLSEFNHIYKKYVQLFPHQKPNHKSIKEMITFALSEIDLPEEEKNTIEKRVTKIFEIIQDQICFDGYKPINIINSVIFLAWMSIDPKSRYKTKLYLFFKKFNINFTPATSLRYKDIVNALVNLSKDIPWIKESQNEVKKRIAYHINDIIENSDSILYHFKCDQIHENELSQSELKVLIDKARKDNYCEDEDFVISDNEIDYYIRSEEEVKLIKRFKKISD